jgi:hypothetical protein
MSVDFAALVHAFVAGASDIRACLMVSRDGLALGTSPADEEEKALAAWSQIASLGEVDRGFVGLRDELWVFCRRGPYAALAKAAPSARAGLILDRLEEMLLVAEEVRLKKEPFRAASDRDPVSLDAPRGPRTSLHRETRDDPATKAQPHVPPGAPARPVPPAEPEPDPVMATPIEGADERAITGDHADEIDTMALRREFAGILMPSDKRDEES